MRYYALYTAILTLSQLPKGETFIVQDLIPPILFNEKRNIDIDFMEWAKKMGKNVVRSLGKTQGGQLIYEKL